MSLDIARHALRQIPKPVKDLRYTLIQYPDGLLTIRVYEDQVLAMNDGQRQDVLEYLESMKQMLVTLGYKAGLEGAKGEPPSRFLIK